MEDLQIIELYFARCESAIAETDAKYGRFCRYIAYRILQNNEDAEEVTNDTYLKTWNTIPPNRPESLKGYVGMISNQLSLDRYDAQNAAKRGGGEIPLALGELSESIPDSSGDDICENIALSEALSRFLWSLPQKSRNIFVRRYWYVSEISEIARDYSMSETAVSMLLHRARKKLKKYLEKEGFAI